VRTSPSTNTFDPFQFKLVTNPITKVPHLNLFITWLQHKIQSTKCVVPKTLPKCKELLPSSKAFEMFQPMMVLHFLDLATGYYSLF
jgi:hypothetical protein